LALFEYTRYSIEYLIEWVLNSNSVTDDSGRDVTVFDQSITCHGGTKSIIKVFYIFLWRESIRPLEIIQVDISCISGPGLQDHAFKVQFNLSVKR